MFVPLGVRLLREEAELIKIEVEVTELENGVGCNVGEAVSRQLPSLGGNNWHCVGKRSESVVEHWQDKSNDQETR